MSDNLKFKCEQCGEPTEYSLLSPDHQLCIDCGRDEALKGTKIVSKEQKAKLHPGFNVTTPEEMKAHDDKFKDQEWTEHISKLRRECIHILYANNGHVTNQFCPKCGIILL